MDINLDGYRCTYCDTVFYTIRCMSRLPRPTNSLFIYLLGDRQIYMQLWAPGDHIGTRVLSLNLSGWDSLSRRRGPRTSRHGTAASCCSLARHAHTLTSLHETPSRGVCSTTTWMFAHTHALPTEPTHAGETVSPLPSAPLADHSQSYSLMHTLLGYSSFALLPLDLPYTPSEVMRSYSAPSSTTDALGFCVRRLRRYHSNRSVLRSSLSLQLHFLGDDGEGGLIGFWYS